MASRTSRWRSAPRWSSRQAKPAPEAAAIETARLRGADAARKGKRRMAVPVSYRPESPNGHPELVTAYLDAFDTTKAELAGGEEH
ncbi:hypothetical protein [Methylobacterium sp. WSM2598]|uniref:hypothetical protein n=1 Tax=Methylobacterium sp. WSM2598 TaxID=398261 RepID=UPI00035FEC65|nr:hypothetical protein [Methylobacterium sp. WSM2598]